MTKRTAALAVLGIVAAATVATNLPEPHSFANAHSAPSRANFM